jgi:DNA-directed RNA polymerase
VAKAVTHSVQRDAAFYATLRASNSSASPLPSSSSRRPHSPPREHISELLVQIPSALLLSSRSLYKRIVMTSVYGVTPYTARNHLIDYLSSHQTSSSVVALPSERVHEAAQYLVEKIFESLYSSLFQRAKDIQDWLTTVAAEIGRAVPPGRELSQGRAYPETFLTWTTPLGFQVTQPYIIQPPTVQYRTGQLARSSRLRLITLCLSLFARPHSIALQKVSVTPPYSSFLSSSTFSSSPPPVDIKKQSTAFPPNFIHSLDASHMFLTALASKTKANLSSFAAVHDSFYSHASDYETLQSLIQQTFLSLYSQPILENLRQELVERYAGYRIPTGQVLETLQRQRPWQRHDQGRQSGRLSLAPFRRIPFSHRRMKRERGKGGEERDGEARDDRGWRALSLPLVPPCGDLNLSQIQSSPYFFN